MFLPPDAILAQLDRLRATAHEAFSVMRAAHACAAYAEYVESGKGCGSKGRRTGQDRPPRPDPPYGADIIDALDIPARRRHQLLLVAFDLTAAIQAAQA